MAHRITISGRRINAIIAAVEVVIIGSGVKRFVWFDPLDPYCSKLSATANVQRRQSILKPSQPCDLVVKPLAELHNGISAYRLPADRETLLPASDAPTCRRVFGTFGTHTLASEADGKDVVKFHDQQ